MAATKKSSPRETYIPGTGTVTRSISFETDTFRWMEKKRKELRADRSSFLRMVLEDVSGLRAHPELHGPAQPHPVLSSSSAGSLKDRPEIDKLIEKLLEQKLNAMIARDSAKLKESLGEDMPTG